MKQQGSRLLRRLSVATIATMALVGLNATSAQAGVTGYSATVQYIGGGSYINYRSAASTSAAVVAQVRPGTALDIECQLVGSRLGFSQYSENRTWNKLAGGRGFVHDVLTTTPGGARTNLPEGGYATFSPGIPRCDANAPASSRETRAVDFARSQLGLRHTNLTPDGMWSGWCELFAEQAYGTRGRYGSAIMNYQAQANAGRIRTDTNPPVGALVFYEWGSYGHVGISLGNGQVISTQGYSTPLPVRQHTVTGAGLRYLGWSYAPSGWAGR